MGWFGSPGHTVEALVEAHYASLYRYAYRLSGTSQEAEDLTQETFCQAQNKLDQLRDWTRAKSWLFSILRNSYLHRLRSNKQERKVSLDGVGELAERNTDALPEMDSAQMQAALNELPEMFRAPLILYYFEEFSYREIAEQLSVPIGTVMSRLARAKTSLRQRLLSHADWIERANQGGNV